MSAIDDFVTSWNQFLEDIFQAAELKAKSKGQAAYKDYLIPLLKEIVDDLKEDKSGLSKALREEINGDEASEQVLSYLRKEFTFFKNLIKQVKADQDANGVDDAIDAGKTIKDSFENLIKKLPERWKKILKVLNEILNLLKKGT